MMLCKPNISRCIAALFLAGLPSTALAEFQPSKPVEIVVHQGAGSGADLFAREFISIIDQEKLSPVRFEVVNKTGGGSTTATNYLAGKKGDPHALGVFTTIWVVDPLLEEAAVNTLTSMTPIATVLVEPAAYVVKADSPYKTFQDFIDAAKAKPGTLTQSGGSITSRENITRQLLQNATGAKWAFVPFPTGGERLAALLGGHSNLMMMDAREATERARTGTVRVLAQVSDHRISAFPDVPTLQEAGFNVPYVPVTRGFVAPPGIPEDAKKFYEDLVEKVINTDQWKKYLTDTGFEGEFAKSAESTQFLAKYQDDIRTYLKESGAKVVR